MSKEYIIRGTDFLNMREIVIIGAAGGIGSGLLSEYVAAGNRVFACARDAEQRKPIQQAADEYPERVVPLNLDITDETQRLRIRQDILSWTDSIDVLVNAVGMNAATAENPKEHLTIDQLDEKSMLDMFHVNAIAPLFVVQSLLPELSSGDQTHVLNISSSSGSIQEKSDGGNYSYAGSKAALNMMTRALAFEVASRGITVVAVHPGWVETQIGGFQAEMSPAESARELRNLERSLSPEQSGSFLNYDGSNHSW